MRVLVVVCLSFIRRMDRNVRLTSSASNVCVCEWAWVCVRVRDSETETERKREIILRINETASISFHVTAGVVFFLSLASTARAAFEVEAEARRAKWKPQGQSRWKELQWPCERVCAISRTWTRVGMPLSLSHTHSLVYSFLFVSTHA